MSGTRACCAGLMLLAVVWTVPVRCADEADARNAAEIAKQDDIIRSRGADVPSGYVVDRSLLVYRQGLCTGFRRTLAALGPDDRWLDIGAGEGQAVLDYASARLDSVLYDTGEEHPDKAKVVALSVEDRRTRRWREVESAVGTRKLQYLAGRRLREYGPGELGKFKLITDVVGGFSYSVDLSRFVEQVLDLLEVRGSFFTLLGDVQSEHGVHQPYYGDAGFSNEIRRPDGAEVRMCEWLKSIRCVEVKCEAKDWEPPVEAFQVRKVCNDVHVPPLLPLRFDAGTPPDRRFILLH